MKTHKRKIWCPHCKDRTLHSVGQYHKKGNIVFFTAICLTHKCGMHYVDVYDRDGCYVDTQAHVVSKRIRNLRTTFKDWACLLTRSYFKEVKRRVHAT